MTTSSSNNSADLESSDVESSYFNLHITGLGYVNRVRTVTPKRKKSAPFLACDIAALTGPRDDVAHCYFDLKVSGQEAQRLINKCKDAVDAGCKVLIGFKLGDPWLDIFKYKEGHAKAGQTGVSQKARLLLIYWMNIDGVRVHTHEPKAANGTGADKVPAIPPAESLDASTSELSEADAEAPAMAASA